MKGDRYPVQTDDRQYRALVAMYKRLSDTSQAHLHACERCWVESDGPVCDTGLLLVRKVEAAGEHSVARLHELNPNVTWAT